MPSVWGTSLGTGFWRCRRGVGAGEKLDLEPGRPQALSSEPPSLPGRAPRGAGGRRSRGRECPGVVRSNRMGQKRSGTGRGGGGDRASKRTNLGGEVGVGWGAEKSPGDRLYGLGTGCRGKVKGPVDTPRANPIRERKREAPKGECGRGTFSPGEKPVGENPVGSDPSISVPPLTPSATGAGPERRTEPRGAGSRAVVGGMGRALGGQRPGD